MRITTTSQNTRLDNIIAKLEARSDARNGRNWRALHKLRSHRSNERQPVAELPRIEGKYKTVKPSTVKLGDVISFHGFQMNIVQITKVKNVHTNGSIVYVLRGEYLGGSLSMFNYFIGRINNGCGEGHLAIFQGNDKAQAEILSK